MTTQPVVPPLPPTPPTTKTAGLANASLVLGILGLMCLLPVISPLLALIFGIVAINKINSSHGLLRGQGQAIAGIVLGAVGLIMIPILAGMLLPALAMAREKARRKMCMLNERQLSIIIDQYADEHADKVPVSFADLRPYAPHLDKLLTCPSAARGRHPNYTLTGATNRWHSQPDLIVLREDPANHRGAGGHVLFNDGRVQWQSSAGPK